MATPPTGRPRGRPKGSKTKRWTVKPDNISFQNNSRLKKVGIRFQLTQEQQDEYIKCVQDPVYFIEKYVKFITIDQGLTNIKLYDWQKDMIQSYHDNRRVIVKTGRQVGKTQCTVGYLLHYLLFNKDKTVGVLAQKQKTAVEILTRLKSAMEHIPLWMQQGVKSWNQTTIELENESRIICESTSGGAIRGFTINLLFLDEFAHVPPHVAVPFMTSVYPTISSGTTSKIIITSTPLGLNLYYKMWTDAVKEKTDPKNWNGFKAISIHWTQVPGRDQAWADQQRKVLGEHAYQQDVEADFLGSNLTLISAQKLRNLTFQTPIEVLMGDSMHIHERPEAGHQYVVVVDPAEGKQLDYSVITVIDITQAPYKVVMLYRDNTINDIELGGLVYQTAKHYNDAHVVVENNNPVGALVLDHLISIYDYDHIFFSENTDRQELTATLGAKVPGIRTSDKVKMKGCQRLKLLIETDQLIVNDFNIVHELSTFVLTQKKRYAAEEGGEYYDDCVATLWLFAWLTDQPFFKELSDPLLRERLFAERERQMAEMLPPAPVIESPLYKPPPKLEVRDGVVWIEGSMSWDEAVRVLNNPEDY